MTLTKADRTRQDVLTAAQASAAELVAEGKNDTKVGEAVGVTRQTVNGWRRTNPAFIAAVNLHRREMYADSRERLRALSLEAVGVLEDAMHFTPPIKALPAALAVLKIVGEMDTPPAPTTPDGVRLRLAEARVQAEIDATPMTQLDEILLHDSRAPRVAAMLEKMRREG